MVLLTPHFIKFKKCEHLKARHYKNAGGLGLIIHLFCAEIFAANLL